MALHQDGASPGTTHTLWRCLHPQDYARHPSAGTRPEPLRNSRGKSCPRLQAVREIPGAGKFGFPLAVPPPARPTLHHSHKPDPPMTAVQPLPEAIPEAIESTAGSVAEAQPQLAVPPRPAKPLSSLGLLRTFPDN